MLLDIFAAFFISILTGMGMGSAGLMVIYLSYARSFSQLSAQGANLLLFVASTAFSLILQISRGIIRWKTVTVLTVAGCVGTLLGYEVARAIDPDIVKKCFAVLLILSGSLSVVKIAKDKRRK